MSIKTILNYSPNFNSKKRNFKQIKFIIFHYTGMKKESEAINRLTEIQSEVSCHYLVKNNGEIIKMVPDLYVAWHAGISSWKNISSLNNNSIGIEISNSGHEFNYKKFSKKQIKSILILTILITASLPSSWMLTSAEESSFNIRMVFFFYTIFATTAWSILYAYPRVKNFNVNLWNSRFFD